LFLFIFIELTCIKKLAKQLIKDKKELKIDISPNYTTVRLICS